MIPENKLVEMETNYPRLEQPDLKWIKKFFWVSLGISSSLASVIWFFAAEYYLRYNSNPFHTIGNHGNLAYTPGDSLSGASIFFLLIYIVYTTVLGIALAKRSQSIFTHLLPRLFLLGLQLGMFILSAGAWATLTD
jgi:hypothetical protein